MSDGLTSIDVKIKASESTVDLGIDTNESYAIHVGYDAATVSAANPFGAIRGLETLSQLVVANGSQKDKGKKEDKEAGGAVLSCGSVQDAPRFPHRELLLDTARFFLNTTFLKDMIDAMAYSKLNVLHWHAIDSQSFPIEVTAFPELSEKAAFPPNSHFCPDAKCTYSKEEIRDVVAYAEDRAVRVLLEIDTPGHAKEWGKAYPNMSLSHCK